MNDLKLIIDNIKRYYDKMHINDGRINLSGGEPLGCYYVQEIIDYICSKNISVSIITNGSLLSKDFFTKNKKKISTIGISVDSLNEITNKLIGRCDLNNQVLSAENLINLCRMIKMMNIKLKINICVSKYNINEDFRQFLIDVVPDRLKFLQMTIVDSVNNSCSNMSASNIDFLKFCERYIDFDPVVESREMIEDGYLVIDSLGNIGINNSHELSNGVFNLIKGELTDIIDFLLVNDAHYIYRYR